MKSTGLWLAACLLLLASCPVMAGTVMTYYHLDAQGTPVAATDAVGTVLWRETHDPYGARHTRQSDVEADPLQYTGHAEERETGLVYLGSRVYDPSIGRFTGFDPAPVEAGEPRTFSRYGYAYNNPYGYADPGGESPVDVAFLAVDVLRLSLAIYSGNAAAIQSAAVDTAISAAGVLNPIPLSGQAAKAAVFASRSKAATEGVAASKGKVTVYRVFGGDARAQGFSWATKDPRTVSNFRDAAGLPSGGPSGSTNTADFMITGRANTSDIIKSRSALPLDGNRGGLPEVVIDPKNVTITDFSVLKP